MQLSESGGFSPLGPGAGQRGATAPGGFSPPAELMRALTRSMTQCRQESDSGALLLIGIHNFAMILSAYGHDVAESVVRQLMHRIQGILGPDDTIMLTQRDQFAVILEHSYPEDTATLGIRIATIMQNYGRDHFATAALHVIGAIGSVHFPEETITPEDALDKAYMALNSAQGTVYRPYDLSRKESDLCRQQMGLANYLYSAYKERRLRLAWQPVVASATGAISHYEALLRMVSPSGKVTSAGVLIPIAEKMGLIEDIDKLVLDMVAEELKRSPGVSLGFNVSNLTTENAQWLERVHEHVESAPDIAPRMMVEITETAVQRDLRRVALFVATLQSLGAQVALDDFGSGYTSFRQLKALSVDMVKIDGVFVKDLARNADDQFFVHTLLAFAKGFGLKTVAEYVETGEIAKLLMEMGVDYLQGYYFGKPESNRRWLDSGEYRKD